jgi:hypothetical protein
MDQMVNPCVCAYIWIERVNSDPHVSNVYLVAILYGTSIHELIRGMLPYQGGNELVKGSHRALFTFELNHVNLLSISTVR